jgi:hypothetical protein
MSVRKVLPLYHKISSAIMEVYSGESWQLRRLLWPVMKPFWPKFTDKNLQKVQCKFIKDCILIIFTAIKDKNYELCPQLLKFILIGNLWVKFCPLYRVRQENLEIRKWMNSKLSHKIDSFYCFVLVRLLWVNKQSLKRSAFYCYMLRTDVHNMKYIIL